MPKSWNTDDEFLGALVDSLNEDLLSDETPLSEVDADLCARGGDPERIGRAGAALAAGLLKRRRLAWQDEARAQLQRMSTTIEGIAIPDLPRDGLLAYLQRARKDPVHGGRVSALFRKRRPEDASDNELRGWCEEVEMLRRLATDDGDEEP